MNDTLPTLIDELSINMRFIPGDEDFVSSNIYTFSFIVVQYK